MTDASPCNEEWTINRETAQGKHLQPTLPQSPHKHVTPEREGKPNSWDMKGNNPAMFKFKRWSA